MKIRLLSDLHRETGPYSYEDAGEDVLVLAGDIDNGTKGIEWAKTIPKPVIYVAGNHEHWSYDLHDNIAAMRAAADGSNVHFLENDEAFITAGDETVRFLGCTMWTDYCGEYYRKNGDRYERAPRGMQQQMQWAAEQSMRDFHYVTHKGDKLTPSILLSINQASVSWLQSKLSGCDHQTVVVTHHAPSYESLLQAKILEREDLEPVIRGNRRRDDRTCSVAAYASDLEDLARHADYWMHGHVHAAISYNIEKCIVYCNPRGYNRCPLQSSIWFPVSKKDEAKSLADYNKNPERGDVDDFKRAHSIDTLTTKKAFMLNLASEKLAELNKVITAMAVHVKYLTCEDNNIVAMGLNVTNSLTEKYNKLIYEIRSAADYSFHHQRLYYLTADVALFKFDEYKMQARGVFMGHEFAAEDIKHYDNVDIHAKRALKIMKSSAQIIKHRLKQSNPADQI